MRNTKAFKEVVAQTLAGLAHRGVALAPSVVEDTIEQNTRAVAARLHIQERSARRYFDAAALAPRLQETSLLPLPWPLPWIQHDEAHAPLLGTDN